MPHRLMRHLSSDLTSQCATGRVALEAMDGHDNPQADTTVADASSAKAHPFRIG